MYKHFLFAAVTALTLTACGGAKTGEGYTSGTCKADIVEDYKDMAQGCQKAQNQGQSGASKCRSEIEDFLEKYPDAGCEITNGDNARFGSERIDHTFLKSIVEQLKRVEQMQR